MCKIQFVPKGGVNVRQRQFTVLLGGSSNHAVKTPSVFDVGFLRNVLLLPKHVRIGYNNIISAGQLSHLHTVQDVNSKFYVLNDKGDIISRGHVGEDNIFYLDDMNLLSEPDKCNR
jgi:hypothetical protein